MSALYNYANVLRAGELDIKSARLKAGMTQKELGKILGVTKQLLTMKKALPNQVGSA